MPLELSRLKQLRDAGDKKIAQCPACAAKGNDSRGEHLAIYPNGKYSCVAHPKDKLHQAEIFGLAGIQRSEIGTGPIPVPIRRPESAIRTPKVILVLNSLAAPESATGKVSDTPDPLTEAVSEPISSDRKAVESIQEEEMGEMIMPIPDNGKAQANDSHGYDVAFQLMRQVKECPDSASRTKAASRLMTLFENDVWPPDDFY